MMRRLFIPILVLVAVASGTVWYSARRAPLTTPGANVVLISIDTCRADHLGCYGDTRGTTPHIDAVARDGIVFSNVISPIPVTLPAHCSMLTGTNPPTHGVRDNSDYRLSESDVTLAEAMRQQGYTTAAFVSSFVLHAQFGLAQGFDIYDDRLGEDTQDTHFRNERKAEDVTRAAEAWLEEHAGDRFFLFLHYYDPHTPYEPPEPFASRFSDDLYAGEIAYVDHHIGSVIDMLKSLKLYDSTMVIVTADHGEGRGEHSERWHAFFIYHSTTKVPLIVKLPGTHRPARIDETVALIDLMPTILSHVEIPTPGAVYGEDLSAYFTGKRRPEKERLIYSESLIPTKFGCSGLFGVETQQFKYIQTTRPELYDLDRDPGETVNVVDKHPQQARAFQERLGSVLAEQVRAREDDALLTLDEERIARLESLGYVDGVLVESFAPDSGKEDPKDFIAVFEEINAATDLLRKGNYAGVRRVCERILAERPDTARAHEFLGIVASEEGKWAEKGRHYSEVLRIDPTSAEAHFALGNVDVRQSRLDGAVSHFRESVRLASGAGGGNSTPSDAWSRDGRVDPVVFKARLHLAGALMVQGRHREAITEYRGALSSDVLPSAPERFKGVRGMAQFQLGRLLYMTREYEEAIAAYRAALELVPDSEEVRRGLDAAIAGKRRLMGS